MKENMLNEHFIEAIKAKIPERGKLTNKLVDILFIEKEAVYRRLRGEVPFTLAEIENISTEMNISLDNLIGNIVPNSYPFYMTIINFGNPSEKDYQMIEGYVDDIREDADCPNSEFNSVSSNLPIHFITEFQYLYRFYIMKWTYQFGNPGLARTFSNVTLSDRLLNANREFQIEVQKIANTYLIWNELMFQHLINDINYFTNIRLISKEEVKLLKEDIISLLDRMEKLATTGTFNSGKKIYFYISRLNFATNYLYITSCKKQRAIVKAYILNEVTSTDDEVCRRMKIWIEALKRTSVLISESGSLERIKYFERQHKLINTQLVTD